MSLLELKPRTAQSNGAARLSQEVANSNVKAKPDNYLSGATEPPLPLTPQRLELILAYANKPLRHAEGAPASRIAQRFAPRPPAKPRRRSSICDPAPLAAPFAPRRGSVAEAVLVVAALLPNLTLAAFWLVPSTCLGRSPPRSVPRQLNPDCGAPPPPFFRRVRSRRRRRACQLHALDGTDAVPPSSIIVIRGLPQGSRLSTGQRHGEMEWTLKPDEIGDLHLVLPPFAVGESKLTIQLVAPGDRIVADAATTLRLIADREIAEVGAPGPETEPAEPQVTDSPADERTAASGEETGAIDVASVSPEGRAATDQTSRAAEQHR
jgi:hypothetical protein